MQLDLNDIGGIGVTTEVISAENFKLYEKPIEINKFNPFRIHNDDDDKFIKGYPVIFFTTPRLNLIEANLSRNTFFSYMYQEEISIARLLNFGVSTSGTIATTSPFIKLLTNNFLNFSTKDTTARTKEVGETFYGFKQTLPSAIVDSITGDEFSIKYHDYKNLPILKLHKMWFEYAENVRRGIMIPAKEAIEKRYIDYLSSVYYFILDADFETILYYSKYTGVAPTNLPYSAFSTEVGSKEMLEYDISYIYSYKEDMNPAVLVDFNKISLEGSSLYHNFESSTRPYLPYIIDDIKRPYDEFKTAPNKSTVHIAKHVINGKLYFKLLWDTEVSPYTP